MADKLDPLAVSPAECARLLGISRPKVYDLLHEYSGRFYTPIPEIGNHRSDMKETAIPF